MKLSILFGICMLGLFSYSNAENQEGSESNFKPNRQKFIQNLDPEIKERIKNRKQQFQKGEGFRGSQKAAQGKRVAGFLQKNNPELYQEYLQKQEAWKSMAPEARREAIKAWFESNPELKEKMKSHRQAQFQERLNKLKSVDPEKAAQLEKRREELMNMSPEERQKFMQDQKTNFQAKRGEFFDQKLEQLRASNPERAAMLEKKRAEWQNISDEERAQKRQNFRSMRGNRRGGAGGFRFQQNQQGTDSN